MEQKKKNLQELLKMGLSKKTVSLMTESEIKLLFEKINKKKETKEAVQTSLTNTKLADADKLPQGTTVGTAKQIVAKPELTKTNKVDNNFDTGKVKNIKDLTDEVKEGKKKSKKKANPWAICTSSVGRKDKKKYEDCVMNVKKNIKEGKILMNLL